jgi:hypothetical protein
MTRDARRRRAGELLARSPHPRGEEWRAQERRGQAWAGDDREELLGVGVAWVARVTPRGHVFFVGRHRHLVALTGHRLLAWRRPKRNDPPALDVALTDVRRRAEHPSKPFFQLLVEMPTARATETLVVELRHRDHAFARALGRALGTPTTPTAPAAPAAPAAG